MRNVTVTLMTAEDWARRSLIKRLRSLLYNENVRYKIVTHISYRRSKTNH